ncbi:hypothetical protein BJY01DRAFT_247660 [Aspergillus pseudoustus]|uniref:Uncharacterized protein n=1 Tax=Aspergillus pseudoustus TaxID=1810923 RepID=A0ABR4JZP4_9EURO
MTSPHRVHSNRFLLNKATWQGSGSQVNGDHLRDSIIHALCNGHHLIDTAVGGAVRASGIPRSQTSVVPKFWSNSHQLALCKSLDGTRLY